jgi:peptide/nickel transport system substrate-binding protein
MKHKLVQIFAAVLVSVGTLAVAATGSQATATPKAHEGGNLTIAEDGLQWYPMDPPLAGNGELQANLFDAIYGELFERNDLGQVVPDLALSYSLTHGNELFTINLRHGVKFTDGTPFNAAAVKFNIERDLEPSFGCVCDDPFSALGSITTVGQYTVELHLKTPDGLILQSFFSASPNWIASPTAIGSESETAFASAPVGAGPFEMVSNQLDTKMVLNKNPHYWDPGHPYVSTLTFIDLAQDQPAWAALQAGQAQMILGLTTPSIVQQAQADSQVNVRIIHGISMSALQLNASKAPFNNPIAREAVAYAIDPAPVMQAAVDGYAELGEALQGPGGDFFQKTVPGFRKYDLAKAQALVKQLGGLSMTVEGTNTVVSQTLEGAVAAELEAAGITVTLKPEVLTVEIVDFGDGNWSAITGCGGGVDPDVGSCSYPDRYETHGIYSGIQDAALDGMINRSIQLGSVTARHSAIQKLFEYLSNEEYAIPLYAADAFVISSKSVKNLIVSPGLGGLGATVQLENLWLS